MLQRGIWIWEKDGSGKDEYADFRDCFFFEGGTMTLRISADSNYAVFVNGSLAAFGQYGDFPHCKVADTHDITRFCQPGENILTVTVWYYGVPSMVYRPGKAGVFYELYQGGRLTAASGPHTLCRRNPYYLSGRCKKITEQLGLSFCYDSTAPETPWHRAEPTGYDPILRERPAALLELLPLQPGTVIGGNGLTHFLLDLGREEVGFLELTLESENSQTLLIAFGEHLTDGKVPRWIPYGPYREDKDVPKRDFSVEYITKPGLNQYTNPFRRLGCRYLEIFCQRPIRLDCVGIRPTMYPVTELPFDAGSPRRQQIYDTAVRTLRLCMHEHYEDCPWREQALYTMDSRNQMLCGYYAFGEYRYPRANLWLIAQDRREDGFLSICMPCGADLVIPSFCLHWYQEVWEYTQHSGDLSLAREIWDKLCSVLDAFCRHFDRELGLLPIISGEQYWNFYEWSGSFLKGSEQMPGDADLILNCLFLRAIDTMTVLSEMTGMPFALSPMAQPLREQIRKTFRREDGLYYTDMGKSHICELGCALAVLTGVADEKDSRMICAMLSGEDKSAVATPVSLSMTTFVYDALLQTNRDRYAEFVLQDLDKRCGYMLDQGATTFWETMDGWQAFGNAGSLCHGWSAIAVYYYHKLL